MLSTVGVLVLLGIFAFAAFLLVLPRFLTNRGPDEPSDDAPAADGTVP